MALSRAGFSWRGPYCAIAVILSCAIILAWSLGAPTHGGAAGGTSRTPSRPRPARPRKAATTPSGTPSEAEIEAVCSQYAVPEPPPIDREELAGEIAEAAAQFSRAKVHELIKNASFLELLWKFTPLERERLAYDTKSLVVYSMKETTALNAAEEVRTHRRRLRRRQALQLQGCCWLCHSPSPMPPSSHCCWCGAAVGGRGCFILLAS